MKFGIIGYGNLGKAVCSALVCTGSVKAQNISVCDSSVEALSFAQKEHFHAYSAKDINLMIADADVICIAVKSYVFKELSKIIDKEALRDKFVISMMAGETFEDIYAQIGKVDLACVMPSIAIATNEGIVAYTKMPEELAAIFNKFGYAFEVEPDEINKVTVFASAGLGFAAYIIGAYAKAGESMGFSPETAEHIAALTFRNAADIGDFAKTVKTVATPGGVTEQGIKHMENNDVPKIITNAMKKAYDKMRT